MDEKPVLEEHHGKAAWTNKKMDELRRRECLCLNCANLKPNEPDNCRIAEQLFSACVSGNIALAVTRCPLWDPKQVAVDVLQRDTR